MTIEPGDIQFSDGTEARLGADDYLIVIRQHVELPPPFKSPAPYIAEQRMRVTGPHFGLGAQDVVSVYPPAQADGDFSRDLCHVILRDPDLPWQIKLWPKEESPVSPWLAILLLDSGDYLPSATDELTGTQAVPLADYLNPPLPVLGPDFEDERKRQWLAEFPRLNCTVVDVTSDAFVAVAPLAAELRYLAHAREVGTSQDQFSVLADELPDGQFAVVIGNRVATGSPDGVYVAHLVSLEGFAGYLADRNGLPADYEAVRLLSLARWTFSSARSTAYFGDLLGDLNIGAFTLTPVEPAPEPIQDVIDDGYVAADYRTRLGERTVAWYRGPCLPVRMDRNMQPIYQTAEAALVYDSDTGMFDVSFAAAWQTGRLLALADREFSGALSAWIRDNHRLSQLLAERIDLFRNYGLLGPGDLLTPKLTSRLLRRLIADGVAARLAGPEPVLGPPGDPSGLLRHRHRLPGLLSPADVEELLLAGEDPHDVLSERIRGAR